MNPMTTATQTKITVATVKSFIKKNRTSLLLEVKSSFDSMQDMVTRCEGGFREATPRTYYSQDARGYVAVAEDCKNSLGINGIWFVGGSRDSCSRFETETLIGFEVSNCCGTWKVAIAK
jgi:hypothetical protein